MVGFQSERLSFYYPALLVFFATLFAYNFQRLDRLLRPSEEPSSNLHLWLRHHRKGLITLTIISGLALLALLFLMPLRVALLLGPFGLLSIGYTLKYVYRKGDRMGLRDVPRLKIYLIALTWMGATAILPMIYEADWPVVGEPRFFLHALERFAFVLAITIPFDIRDLKYDASWRQTIPQLLGVKGARWLAVLCLVVAGGLVWGQALATIADELPVASIQPNVITLALLLSASMIFASNEKRSDWYYSLGIESLSILYAAMVILPLLF